MVHFNACDTACHGAFKQASQRPVGNGAGRMLAWRTESSVVVGHLVTAHLSCAVVPVIVFVIEVKPT